MSGWQLGMVVATACSGMVRANEADLPTAVLRAAPEVRFPGVELEGWDHPVIDCNSPAHWDRGTFYLFNSAGHPSRTFGPDVLHLCPSERVTIDNEVNGGRWIEATHREPDGTLYAWYHNEPADVAPPNREGRPLTAPRIGAMVSRDNGATWHDLGLVLEAPPNTMREGSANHYFAGGNGDFSVILDRDHEWFYFLISTYGDFAEQGVAIARMRYEDRDEPVGKVLKWHDGKWDEPGIGGHLTPIFPAKVDWHNENADAFWGPSIHYNTYLRRYVMLLNRSKDYLWSQEGVYVSFCRDLSDPESWAEPQKILNEGGWYPQVIGTNTPRRETDKLASRIARFFMFGVSNHEIVFLRPDERHSNGTR